VWIGRALDDGTIPTLRLGSRVLIPRERFLAWFDGDSHNSERRAQAT